MHDSKERRRDEKHKKERKSEEVVISRIRFGYTGLNSTLFMTGKYNTGKCDSCGEEETIEHDILYGSKNSVT